MSFTPSTNFKEDTDLPCFLKVIRINAMCNFFDEPPRDFLWLLLKVGETNPILFES